MMCPPLVIRWVPSSALGWASLLLLEQVRILSSPGMHLDFCMEVVLDVFTRTSVTSCVGQLSPL